MKYFLFGESASRLVLNHGDESNEALAESIIESCDYDVVKYNNLVDPAKVLSDYDQGGWAGYAEISKELYSLLVKEDPIRFSHG